MRIGSGIAGALLLLAGGCDSGEPRQASDRATASAPKPAAPALPPLPTDAWIGRWVGVEGLALDIARTATRGRYTLKVALLDGAASYDGTAEGDTIRFERNGRTETIRKATGAETGLKWLAAKQDCLIIEEGEGFCRD